MYGAVFVCLTFLHISLQYVRADGSVANFTDLTPMALASSPIIVNSEDICPTDSEIVDGVCKCNLELCDPPPCDEFLNFVRNGTDIPGNCCPLYTCDNCTADTVINGTCACGEDAFLNNKGDCECLDHHKSLVDSVCVCDSNKCELPILCDKLSVPVKVNEGCCIKVECKLCPEDSYPTNYQSDEIEDKCVCFPCPKTECNDTHVPLILRRGTNIPEQCCDLYECGPKEFECAINDSIYANGEWWITEDEQNCTCSNGVSLCNKPLIIETLPKHCLYNDTAIPNNTSWIEDACTNCTCSNGKTTCIAHMCNITVSKVKKYKDCTYDNTSYSHLDSWLTENLCKCTCNNGEIECDIHMCNVHPTENGKQNDCPPLICKKNCKNGYKMNRRGCEICKCKFIERGTERYLHLDLYMKNHNLTEVDILKLLHRKIKSEEQEQPITPPIITIGQNKDCNAFWYVIPVITFLVGALFFYLMTLCWKKKCTYNYSPVSKPMDNNNLPPQGDIKYISEKSPLKT